jgi:hypothetical protein
LIRKRPLPHGRTMGPFSGSHRASARDKRCPSHIRLGKSHCASGRVVVVVGVSELMQPLGWFNSADNAPQGAVSPGQGSLLRRSGFGILVSVFEDRFKLQNPIDGMWLVRLR